MNEKKQQYIGLHGSRNQMIVTESLTLINDTRPLVFFIKTGAWSLYKIISYLDPNDFINTL